MMRTPYRLLALLAILALPLGCGGGGGGEDPGPGPADPGLKVTGPDRIDPFALGARIPITFVAYDPSGTSTVDVVLDADEDLETESDRIHVAEVQAMSGVEQVVRWEAERSGSWIVLATMQASTGATLEAQGPRAFSVSDLGGARNGGSQASLATGKKTAPTGDGGSVVAGEFSGDDFAFTGGQTPQEPDPGTARLQADGHDDIWYGRIQPDLEFDWRGHVGGSGDVHVQGVTEPDGEGAFYLAGRFNGELILNRHLAAGDQVTITSANAANDADDSHGDGFVARFLAGGSLDWVHHLSGAGHAAIADVALLPGGGCIVVGQFSNTATWEGGGPAHTAQDVYDGFVTWYASSGAHVRTHVLASMGEVRPTGVTLLAGGNIVVVGHYEKTLTVPGSAQSPATLAPIDPTATRYESDVFHVVYSSAGRREHAARTGSSHDDEGGPVTALPDGRWAMAGTFEESTVLGLGSANAMTLDGTSDADIFVAIHGSLGNFHTGVHLGGAGIDAVNDLSVHEDGRLLLAGEFETELEIDEPPGPGKPWSVPATRLTSRGVKDLFAIGLWNDLRLSFATHAGASKDDQAWGVAAQPDGGFVLTGSFGETISLSPDDAPASVLTALGEQDAFIARFNADGSNTGFREIWSIHGTETGQELGGSVALIGDVNGDGRSEFAAGEGEAHGSGLGVVHVYDGATGTEIKTFSGGTMGSGGSLARGGDISGDGVPDLIVADPLDDTADTNAGRLWVFSGADWSLHFADNGWGDDDRLGTTVGGDSDVNKDGWNDVVVGAPGVISDPTTNEYLRLYSGRDGSLLLDMGAPEFIYLGWAYVGRLAHRNRDGYADITLAAPYASYPGYSRCGVTYALDGYEVTTLGPATPYGPMFPGTDPGDDHFFGIANAHVGDMDGDGREDVGIGATGANSGAGRFTVMPGGAGGQVFTFDGPAGSKTGAALAYAGDIDGDGHADCIVGSPLDSSGGATWGGAVRVFGRGDFSPVFVWYGPGNGMHAGASVDGGRDVDGDGKDDVIVGAPAYNLPGGAGSRAGIIKVFGKR